MLPVDYLKEEFEELHRKIDSHELVKAASAPPPTPAPTPTPAAVDDKQKNLYRRSSRSIIRTSLDDIARGITHSKYAPEVKRPSIAQQLSKLRAFSSKRSSPYIKVVLQKTTEIVFFEQRSLTVLRGTPDGDFVEQDNVNYAKLLQRKDRCHRTREAEAQTRNVLHKARDVNTDSITKSHVASYVSNFEMFDTYMDLEKSTRSLDVGDSKQLQVTTYKVGGVDKFIEINNSVNFKLALMLTMRILASNVYEPQQRRFRNMDMPDPYAADVRYKYRLELLWRYLPQQNDGKRKAVADMSWCQSNGDILAVAYGIYTFTLADIPRTGMICVWNIKNPVNPERCYVYSVPVVSVEFSPFQPQLLAVGLYNGIVEILDVTLATQQPIAQTERLGAAGCEPITALRWIAQCPSDVRERNIEPLLALSQNGTVMKYRIINSPHLMGFVQVCLDRVAGMIEGIAVERPLTAAIQANRHPQGLELALHPVQADLFYILTDEGCMHRCSTNYPQQHLAVLQAHEIAINAMDYSPWSPKLYLTCGNDWCIRIWMEGILQPLITLRNHMGPVHCAYWSRTHATIIVALNRKTIDIWDIRLSTLKPISSTANDKNVYYTMFKFAHCGRSMAVGNENGEVLMLAFEDMPFPPHFQYKQLHGSLFKALANNAELTRQVKSIGYFGYPEQAKCAWRST